MLVLVGAVVAPPAFSQGIGGFEGPSVLSRGAGTIGNRSGRALGIRFFASLTGTVDDGIVPITVDSSGKIPTLGALVGVEASVGAYGSKTFRRSQLGIDYKGSYRHYNENSYYDGSDQSASIGYSMQPTRQLQVNFRGVGNSISRGLGAFSTIAVSDVGQIVGPTSLLFDNRVNAVQGGMDFNYQKNARLSFVAGGDAYTVRRQSSALVGVNGYTLRGGVQYQYSKSTALTANYNHTHYDFPRAFGESDINGLELGIGHRLSRRWGLQISGGAFRAETEGLQRVGLDPAIAAILGTGTVIQAFYRVTVLPSYSASVTGSYRLFSVSAVATRAVNPGNGVYLASSAENYTGTYSYTGLRKASFGLTGGYSKLGSIGQALSQYGQYVAGVNADYKLFRYTSITARYDYRLSVIDLVGYNRRANRFTLGLTFSPAEIPFSWF